MGHTLQEQKQNECVIESCDDLVGRTVKVHWHFRERRYSVSLKGDNGNWYVVRNTEGHQLYFGKLVLADVRFKVQPAGAKRAYETGKRNVHASVIGTVRKVQFAPVGVVVPCGMDVAYSHNLYPEPEFKVNIYGYEGSFFDKPIPQWPGIEYAEMAALGCRITDIYLNKPQMLVAGNVGLIGR